jgi:hypothetical protein
MTDATMGQPKAPLGVGSIIGESFSILFGKIIYVILIAFVPTMIGLLASGLVIGFGAAVGAGEPEISDGFGVGMVLVFIVNMVAYAITTALLIQLAYDAKLGRTIQVGRYLGPAISTLVPLVILSIVVAILFSIAAVFFIVPGLWVYAVFSVVTPAIVIERAGFGAMGRSASLTKEYRWPIVGTFLVFAVCLIIINLIAQLLVGVIGAVGGIVVALILSALISAIGSGLGSIFISLIYARLREIKEGVSVDQIAAVFD